MFTTEFIRLREKRSNYGGTCGEKQKPKDLSLAEATENAEKGKNKK